MPRITKNERSMDVSSFSNDLEEKRTARTYLLDENVINFPPPFFFIVSSSLRVSLSRASYAASQITAIIFHRYPRYHRPCSPESESNRDSRAHVISVAGQCLSQDVRTGEFTNRERSRATKATFCTYVQRKRARVYVCRRAGRISLT